MSIIWSLIKEVVAMVLAGIGLRYLWNTVKEKLNIGS